jgi:hypothetical protein
MPPAMEAYCPDGFVFPIASGGDAYIVVGGSALRSKRYRTASVPPTNWVAFKESVCM